MAREAALFPYFCARSNFHCFPRRPEATRAARELHGLAARRQRSRNVLYFRGMWGRKAILTQVLCAVVALAAVSILFADDAPKPAPRFAAITTSGEKFTNESLKGKVVLLQFWATWCRYCRQDQPAVDAIHREFGRKGLVVLAVNMGESRKTVKKYLESNPRSCRIVLMENTNLAAAFAARSYPLYVLIDRDGNIAGTQRGAAGERALRRFLTNAGLQPDEN